MPELEGKVAIVTGAGRLRGIGRAAAVRLSELGADIVVTGTGRKPENYPEDEKAMGWKDIESTADQIRSKGRRAISTIVDITDSSAVQNLIAQTIKEFGRVDILVNNAAFARGEDRVPITDVEPSTFQRVVDIKVTGTFLVTQAFVRALKEPQGAKIVNIASTAGKSGTPNTLAYNAGNFALVGMTQSLARELGPLGINVNCVCPGAVETARMDVLSRNAMDTIAATSALGRNGTDDEVGGLVAYLCTEAASWITGQSININGGTVMEA
jgi:3-oxoacyl-[acyl-carrier protein] reductase/meso-butanediol dehydrogenase/(S,S)-butanediol dehydrogenase/diacetyl reductase